MDNTAASPLISLKGANLLTFREVSIVRIATTGGQPISTQLSKEEIDTLQSIVERLLLKNVQLKILYTGI